MWPCLARIAMCFWWLTLMVPGCGAPQPGGITLILAGGSGPEEAFAKKQLQEFHRLHSHIHVTYQATPSSATERHTLYVTWLSSRAPDIDVLNLDVIWVPEFAAAGWLLPLDTSTSSSNISLKDLMKLETSPLK